MKLYRTEAGIRQKELARRIGTSSAYLSQIEGDKRTPSIDFLRKVAHELGVPLELLLLEASHRRGAMTPTQMELFEYAKRLMLLATRFEEGAERASPKAPSSNKTN